jgi:hypothetical protein
MVSEMMSKRHQYNIISASIRLRRRPDLHIHVRADLLHHGLLKDGGDYVHWPGSRRPRPTPDGRNLQPDWRGTRAP